VNIAPWIVANVHLGRLDEARADVGRLLVLQPGFTIAKYRAIDAQAAHSVDHSELYISSLRLAGLPEE
jgi:hypothetical protein